MKAKRLKELLNNIDDNTEIFIRNSVNICGNIQELAQIEVTKYSNMGELKPCIILNTCNAIDIELNEEGSYIDYKES